MTEPVAPAYRLIRLTDASWDPPAERPRPGLPRGEADDWWNARERALRRQREREACYSHDAAGMRENAWRLWEMLVEEGKMG